MSRFITSRMQAKHMIKNGLLKRGDLLFFSDGIYSVRSVDLDGVWAREFVIEPDGEERLGDSLRFTLQDMIGCTVTM